MALGGFCCVLVALLVILAGGSVLFRAAVGLANRSVGASRPDYNFPDAERDPWIGYRFIKEPVRGVPEPGFLKGVGAVLVLAFVDFLAGIAVRIMLGVGFDHPHGRTGPDAEACHFIGIVLCFPLGAWIVSSILPTKFSRACLVLLWIYLILLAIGVGIYGLIYMVDI